ncbi:hypothetical protein [Lentibacillus cibarius]|uniref:Uncharacterized protein n=1 Tax=Lentibacillus cibarius TaxID=2583219 RepID=A0A5S3QGN6_9BACI|nr:hypothetical protein [Lentibacillus cibarius]TMN20889.1 hypothetical protein FFL34_01250 [Lentibacillus cibarius]
MEKSRKMNAKKWSLLAYIFLTIGLAITLWGLSLWEPEYIFYGSILALFQIVWVSLIFKHRESEESLGNYMIVIPTALFMILMIKSLYAPLVISICISLLMLVPIHFLEKYIRYSLIQE